MFAFKQRSSQLFILCVIAVLTAFPALAQEAVVISGDSVLTDEVPSPEILPVIPISRSGSSMNPDISAIGDFRVSYASEGPRNIEAYFNALEVQISSVVDPYARANFLFAFGRDSISGDFGAELEIATLTSLALPYNLQLSLGKFKAHFSKVNQLHPHAFSFTGYPSMIGNYFSDEGLFMEGISASVLLPNPWDIFQELHFEIGRSTTGTVLDNGLDNTPLIVGQLNNFFDMTDNATLGLGFSALRGPNLLGLTSTMVGMDITYKWKPVQYNTYHSFVWQTEGMVQWTDTASGSSVQSFGAYSLFEYQIERRTFAGMRFDYSGLPMIERADERSVSALLRFQPSEFQVFALEFRNVNRNYAPGYQEIIFRAIFGIGTHAAHPY